MVKNKNTGILVAIDGPNCVGKTTIITQLEKMLRKRGLDVLRTKEPTKSPLGRFIMEIQEYTTKETLGCLVAGDRYDHLKNEIIPALKEGKIVLMDRYILSSYIFQGIDGLSHSFIDGLNKNIILPDLQIVLTGKVETLKQRLSEREYRTRFENDPQKELKHLEKGIKTLLGRDVNLHIFENDNNLEKNLLEIERLILNIEKR